MKQSNKKIISWAINVEWNDNKVENIIELPNEVANYIDDFLLEIEEKENNKKIGLAIDGFGD